MFKANFYPPNTKSKNIPKINGKRFFFGRNFDVLLKNFTDFCSLHLKSYALDSHKKTVTFKKKEKS